MQYKSQERYKLQGRYSEAELLYGRSLSIKEQSLSLFLAILS
jgi:hypothetical protein